MYGEMESKPPRFAVPEYDDDPTAGQLPPALLPTHAGIVRALGASFAGGGLLGLVLLAAPHPSSLGSGTILALAFSAIALGLVAIAAGGRLPPFVVPLGLTLGTLLNTAAVHYAGTTTSLFPIFYVWLGLNSFFFLPRVRDALVQVAVIAVAFGVLLAVDAEN